MTTAAKIKKTEISLMNGTAPSMESFEETYKTAYSHGLEAIYSLQTVDLKTIRKIEPLSSEQPSPLDKEKMTPSQNYLEELDLGGEFCEYVAPYFLEEPIKVLGLSSQALSCLTEQHFCKIKNLVSGDLRHLLFSKGIGLGHIDEIQEKLRTFINGRSLEKTNIIDFNSLLLSISDGINFKKLSFYLKQYDLAEAVPLTATEKFELRALQLSGDDIIFREVLTAFKEEARKKEVLNHLRTITKVFIAPWIRSRKGLATQEEIVERVEKVSLNPSKTLLYLEFLAETFTEGQFPFCLFLPQGEQNLFCCDEETLSSCYAVIETALSYFYNNDAQYSLEELKKFLFRDFAKKWNGMSFEFLDTCLKKSSYFAITRARSGILYINLA